MKKEDGLIDWNLTAREISNRVRAFQPFPTSFTVLLGKKLTVWKAQESSNSMIRVSNGAILQAKGEDLIVSCGSGTTLKLLEIQLEGKKRMNVRDFLNGYKIQTGEKFG